MEVCAVVVWAMKVHRSVLGLFGWTEEDFQLGYQKGKQGYWPWPNWPAHWGVHTQRPLIPPLSDITRPVHPSVSAFSPSSSFVTASFTPASAPSSSSSLLPPKGEGTENENGSAALSIPITASNSSETHEQEKVVVVVTSESLQAGSGVPKPVT